MDVTITDEEKKDIKARVLANVEHRLTEELLTQMRREVVREMLSHVHKTAKEKLGTLLMGAVTDTMIQAEIQRALKDMASTSYGRGSIRENIDKAVLQVVAQYTEIVGKELYGLLHEAVHARLRTTAPEKPAV